MSDVETLLGELPFFYGMEDAHLATIAETATAVDFVGGSTIFEEGGEADSCYLLLEGDVALELIAPGRGPHVVQTLHSGDVLGWSWLFPPYRWLFDAQALTDTRAVRFDAPALRAAKDTDPALGYDLLSRFAEVIVARMQAARIQLMDIYGSVR